VAGIPVPRLHLPDAAGRMRAMTDLPFESLYRHGYVRVAAAVPRIAVSSVATNVDGTLAMARAGHERDVALVVFPELGLSGYTNDDLFFQDALLDAVEDGIRTLVEESARLRPMLVIGAPIRHEAKLFNCAIAIAGGRILGAVPKTYLPNYREFYEKRQFVSGDDAIAPDILIAGAAVPFGSDLIFEAANLPGFAVHAEICEDVWTPIPPSTFGALAGATVLANLSASNVTIGKADYRRLLCSSQSAKCIASYIYTGAGAGESTTDLAWDGHALIYENGDRLTETSRFTDEPQLITADVDLDRLRQERTRMNTYTDAVRHYRDRLSRMRRIGFELDVPAGRVPLDRNVSRFPFVPANPETLDERCRETYEIQVQGLLKRLRATRIEKVVIGVSGGLDSTQALLVAVKALDRLGLPRANVLGYSLPGFATSKRTRDNSHALMNALGITAAEIDIRPSAAQMLRDIGHPAGNEQPVYDVTYENVQAGERTSHLFRLANLHNGLVLGTGDLSEIALGYATYGVGDHMSHYNVNASVPKTLIQHLVRWSAGSGEFDETVNAVLRSIADTPISPELVPGKGDEPHQSSEAEIGPYALHDFFLYYVSRFGFRPGKVAFLAEAAWGDPTKGAWPETVPPDRRIAYDRGAIKTWLERFLFRFFQFSQFKRSALPNGPKVGSGGSLSPRGDWRAPSDAVAEVWLDALRREVP
jgi:NAD+ synthase (glutamine-hydrolysing)